MTISGGRFLQNFEFFGAENIGKLTAWNVHWQNFSVKVQLLGESY
jgi:hypothetical protein